MKDEGVEVFGVFTDPGHTLSYERSKHGLVVRFGRHVIDSDGLDRYEWPTYDGRGKLLGLFSQQAEARAAILRYESMHRWSYLHRQAIRFWALFLVGVFTVGYVHHHDGVDWLGSLIWGAVVCWGVGMLVWVVTEADQPPRTFWQYDSREGLSEP